MTAPDPSVLSRLCPYSRRRFLRTAGLAAAAAPWLARAADDEETEELPMGYKDPRAIQGVVPFTYCDNHLLLAEQRGLGVLDLKNIEVVGTPIAEAVVLFS